MKITLIRKDNGSGKETLSVCDTAILFEKMKTETKSGHITALRNLIPELEGKNPVVWENLNFERENIRKNWRKDCRKNHPKIY